MSKLIYPLTSTQGQVGDGVSAPRARTPTGQNLLSDPSGTMCDMQLPYSRGPSSSATAGRWSGKHRLGPAVPAWSQTSPEHATGCTGRTGGEHRVTGPSLWMCFSLLPTETPSWLVAWCRTTRTQRPQGLSGIGALHSLCGHVPHWRDCGCKDSLLDDDQLAAS